MTRQAHWKRQHRRDVVLASLALGALMSAAPVFALADEQLDANSPVIDCFEYQANSSYNAAPLPYFGEMQAVIDDEANAPSSEGDVPGSSDSTYNGSADNTEGNNTGQDGAPSDSNTDASNTGQTGTSNSMGASQGNAGLDGTPSGAGANNGDTGQNTISSSSNAKQDSASSSSDAGQSNASGAGSSNGTTQGNVEGGVSADQGNGTQDDAANGANENQGVASGNDGADQNGATSGASADQNSGPDGTGSKADERESTDGSADGSTSDTDTPGAGTDASQGGTTDKGDNPQPGTPEPDTPGMGTDASQGGTTDKGDGSQPETPEPDKPGTGTDAPQGGTTDKGDGSQPETPSPDKPESNPPSQEPAVLIGWQNIGGYRYYYDNDGKPLTGLQTIEDKTYLFNEKGQLGYGFLYLGNNVVSYFDPITGSQLTGKQFIHGSWRNIDEQTGLNCGLTEVSESGKTNTYYYDNYDGGLHTGQQYVNNSWHFFDEDTGRMYTRDEEVRRIVQFALAELGGSESTAFGYLKEVKADGGSYCGYGPCMATVRHIFKAAGMSGFLADGFVDSWPHKYLDLMIEKGQHDMTPRVGSVAFFRWENSFANQIGVSADHAEIVVEVGDGWYKTVGAIAGGIKESIYHTAGAYNIGFGVPAFHR